MNDRIKNLAEQSGFVLWKDEAWRPAQVIDWGCSYDDELEKFAKLLLNECVQACINKGKTYEVKSAGEYQSAAFADAIKQHFGVD